MCICVHSVCLLSIKAGKTCLGTCFTIWAFVQEFFGMKMGWHGDKRHVWERDTGFITDACKNFNVLVTCSRKREKGGTSCKRMPICISISVQLFLVNQIDVLDDLVAIPTQQKNQSD